METLTVYNKTLKINVEYFKLDSFIYSDLDALGDHIVRYHRSDLTLLGDRLMVIQPHNDEKAAIDSPLRVFIRVEFPKNTEGKELDMSTIIQGTLGDKGIDALVNSKTYEEIVPGTIICINRAHNTIKAMSQHKYGSLISTILNIS